MDRGTQRLEQPARERSRHDPPQIHDPLPEQNARPSSPAFPGENREGRVLLGHYGAPARRSRAGGKGGDAERLQVGRCRDGVATP